jgi:hypothetical protein
MRHPPLQWFVLALFIAICLVQIYFLLHHAADLNSAVQRTQRVDPKTQMITPFVDPSPFLIHMFWTSNDGALNAKVETALRSALRTQHGAKLMLWTTSSSFPTVHAQTSELAGLGCACGFELRSTDELVRLAQGDSSAEMRSCSDQLAASEDFKHAFAAFSDLIRFVALYYYGGIYADSDMVFLHDLRNFQGMSFAYKWGREKLFYNTALMGLAKGSQVVPQIISKAGECTPAAFYPTRVHEKLTCAAGVCAELIMMPTALFSPASGPQSNYQWQDDNAFGGLGITTDWFFDRVRLWDLDHFFPGAHTFHWHNRWTYPIHNDSFFADLQRLNAVCQPRQAPPKRRCKRVFVDLGGYNGDTLALYSGHNFITKDDNFDPSIYVFEIDFKHITSILARLNGPLSHAKVFTQVLNVAAWSQDTVLRAHLTGHNDGRVATEGGLSPVLAYDIGAWFMRTIKPELCDDIMLKMDIEGAEIEAVTSLVSAGAVDYIDHLVVEWHDWIMPAVAEAKPRLVKLLEANGLFYQYATLDDIIDKQYMPGEPWPVNHCDSHYKRKSAY